MRLSALLLSAVVLFANLASSAPATAAETARNANLLKKPADPASWVLEQHESATATVSADGDRALKVTVTAASAEPWHIQFFQGGLALVEGATYTVRFRAKADAPRSVSVGAGIEVSDWHNIGLNETLALTTEWQDFSFSFKATNIVEEHARLPIFALGQQTGTLWLADASLEGPSPAIAQAKMPDNFFPFVIPWDDNVPGTATDVSFLNPRPAGANGRIIVRDGHFVEEKTLSRVRFLGFNIGANSAFPEKADADILAAKLAKAGVNIVRLHHLDNTWAMGSGGSIWDRTRADHQVFDAQQLDKLDYLIAKLKEQGIYVNLNLKVSRTLTEADGMPPSVSQVKFDFQKRLDFYNARWRELQKDYARKLLAHVNPYTKLAYTEDPAVAVVEINNENSLVSLWSRELGSGLDALPEPFKGDLLALWNQWLAKKYANDDQLAAAWKEGVTPPGESVLTGQTQWTTENQGESQLAFKQLDAKPDQKTAADIEADVQKVDATDWHVQVHLVELTLNEGWSYTITFRGRADQKRTVGVTVNKDRDDWHNMGLAGNVELTPEWKDYTLTFKAKDIVPGEARLAFVLGGAAGKVFLSDIALAPGAKGAGLQSGESLAKQNIGMPTSATDRQQADWVQFLVDTERAYADDMRDFLKDTLKVQANIALSQIDYGGITGMNREQRMEFADAHAYWQHPSFPPDRPWSATDWTIQNTPQVAILSDSAFGELGRLAMNRVAGKPYSISEYDHPAPSDYACEMMPTYSTFAALQDWDIIYTFAEGAFGGREQPDRITGFFDQNNHPGKWAFSPSAALIFRLGLITPAPAAATLQLPAPFQSTAPVTEEAWRKVLGQQAQDFANRRLAVSDQPLAADQAAVVREEPAPAGAQSQVRLAKTDAGALYVADAPAAVAAAGFMGGQTVAAKQATLSFQSFEGNFAAFTLVAIDGKPLNQSKRALLTLTGRVQNTGMVWNAQRTSVGTKWGQGPTLAQNISASVKVASDGEKKVWALDGTGKRAKQVPVSYGEGVLSFNIDPQYQTLWYEIAAE